MNLAEKYEDLYRNYFWQHVTQMKTARPIFIDSAKGCRLKDVSGREYLDTTSALGNMILGYGNEEIFSSMFEKATKGAAFVWGDFVDPDQVLLAQRLVEILPKGLNLSKVYFQSSGSEANEAAFKMARQYHYQTGNAKKFKVISLWMAYHGATAAALSATGTLGRRVKFEPLVPGFIHVFPPYCYRCFFGKQYPGCELECAQQVARVIELEGPETVAAFIAEPYTWAGGANFPPPEYLEMIDHICKENDVLLILDEVGTGFGKTGKMFAMSHYNVNPDMVVIGKGITAGYAPLSAVCTTKRIYDAFYSDANKAKFNHIITYGGNPISCAAALKTIEIIERENLVERARELGQYLQGLLDEHLGEHTLVSFIQGKGLSFKIEVVRDKRAKEPLMNPACLKRFREVCLQQGVASLMLSPDVPRLGTAVLLRPALIIEKEELDFIVRVIRDALDEVKKII